MPDIYHVNFHTIDHRPIFVDELYASALDSMLADIVRRHAICELARAIMPTHAHFIIVSFPDQPRPAIVQLLKGASAYAFFEAFPTVREELGGHLWQASYQWVQVTTHRQLRATIDYVHQNRAKIGLHPMSAPESRGS